MELINKIRKSRKGFTLVEIIVVLVILAVLAAFTIPTMLGFVNDAKAKALIAEAREVYVAAQSTATEFSVPASSELLNSDKFAAGTDKETKQMKKYIGTDIPVTGTSAASWTVAITTAGKVDSVAFVKGGHTITIDAKTGTTTVS